MTVAYTQKVATSRGGFYFDLIFRWKGSIYKLLWKEFFLFLFLYYMLRTIYRNILNEDQKRVFEQISEYTNSYIIFVPFSFVLGFYMQVIFTRWLALFNYITWPDRMAFCVTAYIKGLDERGRLLRRTIMRYLMVGYVMNQTSCCPSVKRRFPTLNHLTQAGLLTAQEERIIENIPQNRVNKYAIPFYWSVSVIALARKEGRIYDDYAVKVLNQELLQYRVGLGMILRYDAASMPLVYTQSVTLAVHMFVLFSLFGYQFLEQRQDGGEGDIDQFIHLGGFLQFFLFMGWLKLGEMMINPFGDDDDDFDMNVLIDRNIQYCFLVVDDLHSDIPPLEKDMHWNEQLLKLPYTKALQDRAHAINMELGSAYEVVVPEDKSAFVTSLDDSVEPSRSSVETRELTPTPEESNVLSKLKFTGGAFNRHGTFSKVTLKRTLSGTIFSNPKKILETIDHQFRPAEDIPEISDPFDNRFQEVEYKESDEGSDNEDVADTAKVRPDQDTAGSGSRSSNPIANIKRYFGREFWRSHSVVERKEGSTGGVAGTPSPLTSKKSVIPEDPQQVPSPQEDPHPSEQSRQSGGGWHLPN